MQGLGAEVFGYSSALEGHAGAKHADMDALTLAGSLARQQTHEHCLGGHIASGRVDLRHVAVDLGLPTLGSADRPEAREVLGLHVGTRFVAHWPDFAPTGDRRVDDVGIDCFDLLVADAHSLGGTRPHIDQEDVAGLQQLVGSLAVSRRFEVEEQSALVLVPGHVPDRSAIDGRRYAGAQCARIDGGLLDVDHIGTERAELGRCPGSDHPERQIEDAHAF